MGCGSITRRHVLGENHENLAALMGLGDSKLAADVTMCGLDRRRNEGSFENDLNSTQWLWVCPYCTSFFLKRHTPLRDVLPLPARPETLSSANMWCIDGHSAACEGSHTYCLGEPKVT
ncbi:hypothetical protein PMIN07_001450 [Paraphaeosphaeria minitans]